MHFARARRLELATKLLDLRHVRNSLFSRIENKRAHFVLDEEGDVRRPVECNLCKAASDGAVYHRTSSGRTFGIGETIHGTTRENALAVGVDSADQSAAHVCQRSLWCEDGK